MKITVKTEGRNKGCTKEDFDRVMREAGWDGVGEYPADWREIIAAAFAEAEREEN